MSWCRVRPSRRIRRPQERGRTGGGRGGRAQEPEIRPYDRVITKEAKSDDGVFTVHRIKDRIYYEIPKERLGREFLWVSQIAKTTLGAGYGGQAAGNRVVKWERRGDRIFLRAVSYDVIADPTRPSPRPSTRRITTRSSWRSTSRRSAKTTRAVIDVTRLFTTDVPEFSGRTRVGARAFDASRSFVERAVSFPENIEVEATHTYNNPPQEAAAGGRGAPPPAPGGGAARHRCGPAPTACSCTSAWCMLPEKPMQARLFDDRVGYFSTAKSTTARTSTARRSAATSRAGAWRRRTRAPRCPSRSSRSSTGSIQPRRRSGCRT